MIVMVEVAGKLCTVVVARYCKFPERITDVMNLIRTGCCIPEFDKATLHGCRYGMWNLQCSGDDSGPLVAVSVKKAHNQTVPPPLMKGTVMKLLRILI